MCMLISFDTKAIKITNLNYLVSFCLNIFQKPEHKMNSKLFVIFTIIMVICMVSIPQAECCE